MKLINNLVAEENISFVEIIQSANYNELVCNSMNFV